MDNKSVLINSTAPDSTLKKKSNSVTFHIVREVVAQKEWLITCMKTKENPAMKLPQAKLRSVFGGKVQSLKLNDINLVIQVKNPGNTKSDLAQTPMKDQDINERHATASIQQKIILLKFKEDKPKL